MLFHARLANHPLFLLLGILLIVIGVEFVSLGHILAQTCHENQEQPIYVVKAVLEWLIMDGSRESFVLQ